MAKKTVNTPPRVCMKCGTGLNTFAGYVPSIGEVCMDCYKKYVVSKDKD